MSEAEAGARGWDAVKSAVVVGIEQSDRGELEPCDADEIWAEAERRFAEWKKEKSESHKMATRNDQERCRMPEAFQHVNRRGGVYYLQAKPDKSGKPKYSFARKLTGTPVPELPEGYEVRELPDSAQVMVRRKRPSAILRDEKQLLERIVRRRAAVQMFIVDVEDQALVVYTSDMEPDVRLGLLRHEFGMDDQAAEKTRNFMLAHARYSKMMRFTLADAESRLFEVDRWCFMGSIDDWYLLDGGAPLAELAEKYVGHLGRESFFDLM